MATDMEKFIEYFKQANKLFRDFGLTIQGITLDEKEQPFELYCMLALKLSQNKSQSISILLSSGQFADAIILSRQFMELVFNINWINNVTGDERKERVYELEAEPYYNFSKELREMEQNCESDSPIWDKKTVKGFRESIENEKDTFPFLVKRTADGGRIFKNPDKFIQRLDPELKLRYYHLYRFTSLFIHPGPKLKDAFLKRKTSDSKPIESIIEPTKQIMAYTLLFSELIMGYGIEIFNSYNVDKSELRKKYYAELASITDQANEGYFGKPK